MKDLKINHIGIAVNNLEKSVDFYSTLLSLDKNKTYIEELPTSHVTAAFLDGKETSIEFITPLGDKETSVTKFLSKNGEGIHHICFEVENLEAKLEELSQNGFDLIDKTPRMGARGHKIAFIHPKSSNGVLIELCQAP